jgi:organic radical activating enzyme
VKPKGYLSEIFVSFQGEGSHVGRRHLFVRFAGCNLRCRYCDTPDSLERTPGYTLWDDGQGTSRENPVTPDELAVVIGDYLARKGPIDAIALTGGEPLLQSEFIAAALGAQSLGAPVLLETNGVLPRRLAEVLPFVDIISMDIKLPSNTGESQFWEAHRQFLEIGRSREIYVKVVVDDGTSADEVESAFKLVARHAPEAPAFLQPMTAADGGTGISATRLEQLYGVARRRHVGVRVLPQAHKLIGIQ